MTAGRRHRGCQQQHGVRVEPSRRHVWAARNEYRLRYVDGELRMAYKKVTLVNNEKALYTLSFLI